MTGLGRFGVKLGHERIRAILDRINHPERGMRGALVAGTNGKGSTCAILASILESAGLHTGMMPSPHLQSYRERVQLDSTPISEAEFAAAVAGLRPRLEDVTREHGQPTEFEILTALAVDFLAPRIDRFVCEVGMGGRLDVTNVFDLGVAVVTNVGLDHMSWLGDSVEAIAAEKAAIIKPGDIAVTGAEGAALAIVEKAAADAGAELWRLGRELRLEARWLGWEGSEIDLAGPGFEHRGLRVKLLGSFQAANAALAVAAAQALGDADPDSVRAGVERARWPGRLEQAGSHPRLLLDGGHNPDGLDRLVSDIPALIGDETLVIVFAAMADKDLEALVERLRKLNPKQVVFTAAASAGERAMAPERLSACYGGGLTITPARKALDAALELAGRDGCVLVCGSLYLVGELRAPVAP